MLKKTAEKDKSTNTGSLSAAVNVSGLVLFVIACAAATYFSWPYISEFIRTPTAFPEYIRTNLVESIFIYLAMQVLQVVVAVIPGEILEVAAGLAFGWFGGFLLVTAGIATGTIIIFFVLRKFGKPLIVRLLGEKDMRRIDRLNSNPKKETIIFWIFFIPGLPKDLLTYAAAFFDIPIQRFLLLTLIARIPSIITSTYAGKSIIEGDYKTAVIIFVITGIIAVAANLLSRKK